jgi:hypothetical protein
MAKKKQTEELEKISAKLLQGAKPWARKRRNDRTKKIGLEHFSSADKKLIQEKAAEIAKVKELEGQMLKQVTCTAPPPQPDPRTCSSDILMPRSFRWVLCSQNLKQYFNKSVSIDYVAKRLHIQAYLVVPREYEMDALTWGDQLLHRKLNQERLEFENYDGNGNVLFTTYFNGLSLVAMSTNYDYANSDPVIVALTVQYTDCVMKPSDHKVV